MANDEGMEFWKEPANATPEKDTSEEMGDELTGTMKLKVPKPIFNTPTKCKILEMKFFRVDKTEKNKNDEGEYTPFFATLTFQEIGGKEVEFKETYRGGRIYAKDNTTSTYIGPTSSLGKFKIVCIDNKFNIGNSLKEWAQNVIGANVMMKAETVTYLGKKYDKNAILTISKE